MTLFKKKDNEDVQELFAAFLEYSTEGAKTICELESVSGTDSTGDFPERISISLRVSIEFVLFYIHLLDRKALHILPEKRRLEMLADFVDRTVRVIPTLSEADSAERSGKKYGQWYLIQFLARQDEYWQFEKLMSEDPSEPAAFQCFGGNISRLFGKDPNDNVSIPCQAYVVESLKHMDIKGFVMSMA